MSITRPIERVPPQNLEAEQSVLGSMLLDRDAIARVVESIRPEDFYRDHHRTIFTAMLELFERGEPVDLITVTNKLAGAGKLEDVGGATYLASLPNTVPTAANAEFYAGIVLEKAILRSLISAGTQIASLGYDGMDEVSALIDQSEKLVYGIAARRNMQDFQTIKEILKTSFEKIDKRYQDKGTVTGVATGFTDFDMLTSGLQPADMVIVAARPSVGKCLSYDSEILLADGRVAPIEEIYRRREGRLLTLGSDGKFRTTQPSAFVDDGIKRVFRVTTRLGRTVECTAIHPFLTIQGWLPLAALRVGDRVAVPRKVEVFGQIPLPEREIKLLASVIGEGSLSGHTPPGTDTDPRLVEDVAASIQAFGAAPCRPDPATIARRPRGDVGETPGKRVCAIHGVSATSLAPCELAANRSGGHTPRVLWLMRNALRGTRASRKTIPPAVFTLPRAQLALFLNRLFATGGWARVAPTSRQPHIGYATTSEGLARQIQHLLLRFGIIAGLNERAVTEETARRSTWTLHITEPASIKIFANDIGIFGKEAQITEVLAAVEAQHRYPTPDPRAGGGWRCIATAKKRGAWASRVRRARLAGSSNSSVRRRGLPRNNRDAMAQTLEARAFQPGAKSDVYWDEIVSIEPRGAKQVYDLTIPETHNFVANDVCVHNTTLSLNVAQHAAINLKIPVAIFSLETSKEQLVQRILCSEARVDNSKLRTGYLADEDWRKLARAMGSLSEAPIFIDDSATLSVMEMRAKARKLRAEHGLGLIVVDYIQLIQSFKRTENRTQELSEIARGIKSLAKELDLPIIAVSQLSRAVETMGSKRPMLSHLRECVTEETLVLLADGRPVPIRDLVGTTPRVLSLSPDGRVVQETADAVWRVGRRAVFEVRLASGRRIRATSAHRLYGGNGWVPVKELNVGDRLGVARHLPGPDARAGSPRAHASSDPTAHGGDSLFGFAASRGAVLEHARVLDKLPLSSRATNEVSWDRVVSIEPAGLEDVFDLTVPGPASWLADGIVSHNSGEIEQVSDLVVFLYREDYYDAEKAQKDNKENVCELIIAKHRNGPIGSVELYFHKEFSRFANLDKRR